MCSCGFPTRDIHAEAATSTNPAAGTPLCNPLHAGEPGVPGQGSKTGLEKALGWPGSRDRGFSLALQVSVPWSEHPAPGAHRALVCSAVLPPALLHLDGRVPGCIFLMLIYFLGLFEGAAGGGCVAQPRSRVLLPEGVGRGDNAAAPVPSSAPRGVGPSHPRPPAPVGRCCSRGRRQGALWVRSGRGCGAGAERSRVGGALRSSAPLRPERTRRAPLTPLRNPVFRVSLSGRGESCAPAVMRGAGEGVCPGVGLGGGVLGMLGRVLEVWGRRSGASCGIFAVCWKLRVLHGILKHVFRKSPAEVRPVGGEESPRVPSFGVKRCVGGEYTKRRGGETNK